MKSLVKKLARIKFAKFIRNSLNIKPIYIDMDDVKENISVSDAFVWRTDNGFKTIFKFLDILNLFYKVKKSSVELVFFNNENKKIKEINLGNLDLTNELIVDKKFLNNTEGYGIFYIFHRIKNHTFENKTIISSRDYVGFSYKNNLSSFVHGNILAISKNLDSDKINSNFIKTSYLSNQKYRLQNNFKDFDKTELLFSSPTSKRINFSIKGKKYFLSKNSCILLSFENLDTIEIKSNCYFLRPLVFNYKGNFIDVYHG